MIFRSVAIEGAPFCSYIVLGLRARSNLRNSINKIEGIMEYLFREEKIKCQDLKGLAR